MLITVKMISAWADDCPLETNDFCSKHSSSTDICDAAAIREPSAETSPFQRIEPGFPPSQNDNSADLWELPA